MLQGKLWVLTTGPPEKSFHFAIEVELIHNVMLVSGIFNVEMTLSLYKSLSGLWIFCHCIPEAAWSQRSRVWVVSPSAVVDPRFSLLMQSVGKRK